MIYNRPAKVFCIHTGIPYDPYVEFDKLMEREDVIAALKRLKDR